MNSLPIRTIYNNEYPFLLRQIGGLPEQMHLAGQLPSDNNKFLCVVGSRRHSEYGLDIVRKLISGLAGYPIVIISGLAIGIDSLAHEEALKAGLKTLSFPGSGLSAEALYPRSRRELASKIVDSGGGILSSFEYNQSAAKWTFPARNRLMAGSAHAVLIIEAAKGSGTLITADFAAEFNRDVLVVPGSIFSDLSYGFNMLVRKGSTPISCSEDILQSLGFSVTRGDGMNQVLPNFAEMSLSPDQREIIDFLRIESLTASDLIRKTGYSITRLNLTISELELLGTVSMVNGKYKIL